MIGQYPTLANGLRMVSFSFLKSTANTNQMISMSKNRRSPDYLMAANRAAAGFYIVDLSGDPDNPGLQTEGVRYNT